MLLFRYPSLLIKEIMFIGLHALTTHGSQNLRKFSLFQDIFLINYGILRK